MRIAIVAWSPLASGPRWHNDGPLLPIEFAWTSDHRLIPVLCGEPWVLNVRTLWARSRSHRLDAARDNWADREGVPRDEIGYVQRNAHPRLTSLPDGDLRNRVLQRLEQWRQDNGFDAVVWRDSGANLFQGVQQGQTIQAAKQWVEGNLRGHPQDSPEASYIRRTPIQVWTVIRAYIKVELDWEPDPITTGDDLRLQDWKECRTTAGRLDTILVDLRKVGFSIITGLLTASAFLNFLGVPTKSGSDPGTDVSAVVFITVMVLVAALFSADTYYQVLLSGAVERAMDLEAQTNPPIRITRYLSRNATRSGVSFVILGLYLVLLATGEGMGLFAAHGQLSPGWPSTWGWVPRVGLATFVVGFIAAIVAYIRGDTGPHPLAVIVVIALSLLTVILSAFLLSSAEPEPVGVRHWIAAVGMFLALYIEFYWLYVAWRSGLYRQSPDRNWSPDI
jgi:hypothetical protein